MINPLVLVGSLLDPFVAAGVGMQIWWLVSRMTLFSIADLTFVLPVTAIGYAVTSVLGRIFLHETITPTRWTGIALVCVGSFLVGGTPRDTTGSGV
jgi:drug/metabolite transporter (DMT)-like permease